MHCIDVIMSPMTYQITSLTIVYSTVYFDTDQWKHQSSASLAFVNGIHRWPVNSPHKGPVMTSSWVLPQVICCRFPTMDTTSANCNHQKTNLDIKYREIHPWNLLPSFFVNILIPNTCPACTTLIFKSWCFRVVYYFNDDVWNRFKFDDIAFCIKTGRGYLIATLSGQSLWWEML